MNEDEVTVLAEDILETVFERTDDLTPADAIAVIEELVSLLEMRVRGMRADLDRG